MRPYFEFVRENRPLFKAVLSRRAGLDTQRTFDALFEKVFSPVLDRFHFAEKDKPYVISFYIAGLMAVVAQWTREDCRMPIDTVIGIVMQCILPGGAEAQLRAFGARGEAEPCAR